MSAKPRCDGCEHWRRATHANNMGTCYGAELAVPYQADTWPTFRAFPITFADNRCLLHRPATPTEEPDNG